MININTQETDYSVLVSISWITFTIYAEKTGMLLHTKRKFTLGQLKHLACREYSISNTENMLCH
jgi:hypothetical protein